MLTGIRVAAAPAPASHDNIDWSSVNDMNGQAAALDDEAAAIRRDIACLAARLDAVVAKRNEVQARKLVELRRIAAEHLIERRVALGVGE